MIAGIVVTLIIYANVATAYMLPFKRAVASGLLGASSKTSDLVCSRPEIDASLRQT